MLFKALPNLYYNVQSSPVDVKLLAVKNIFRRAEILKEFKTSVTIFDEFLVNNGEKPEVIANRIYKNPFYAWTLFIANDIINYYEQWPRSSRQLAEYVESKYDNPQATKHYITTEVKQGNNIIVPAGKVVPQNYSVSYFNGTTTVTANPTVSITNYQFEEQLNSKKERIQVIRPSMIEQFVEVYKRRVRTKDIVSVANSAFSVTM
tara:strand:- start:1019 stop:1633 length:615 start_codon:yes stop_codon:yes gene_type:complete